MSADKPLRFELDRLLRYDDGSVLAEMKRVADEIDTPVITRDRFDMVARVSSDTCIRRFGGWREALAAAGLEDRYGGKRVSRKMRDQASRSLSREDIACELQRIAKAAGRSTITRADVLRHSDLIGERVILNRFGSWPAALDAAGLKLSSRGRRWTNDDYFENLLMVWTHYGRPPRYAEMDQAPSRITSGGYAAKFGTWGEAKAAFIARVNSDLGDAEAGGTANHAPPPQPRGTQPQQRRPDDRRSPSLGLRYQVLRRDRYRCVLCGRSPSTDLACVLHVDHVVPFSRGGKTTLTNLRSLCEGCNLGRGDRHVD